MRTSTQYCTLLARPARVIFCLTLSALAACEASGTDGSTPMPADGSGPTGEGAPTEMAPPAQPGDQGNTGVVTGSGPRPTQLLDQLQALGYDINDLPELDQVFADLKGDRDKVHALMESFSTSLGVRCSGCHTVMGANGRPDFEAPTPEKNVAIGMWNQFVRNLTFRDGTPVYCDSCHQGRKDFLDRSNPRALGAWMNANFVQELARRDGRPHACATCHGDPFQGEFLSQWRMSAE